MKCKDTPHVRIEPDCRETIAVCIFFLSVLYRKTVCTSIHMLGNGRTGRSFVCLNLRLKCLAEINEDEEGVGLPGWLQFGYKPEIDPARERHNPV